jgi:hypothetical protein
MTLRIADIASYQGALKLTDLTLAGFGGVNFKISHGLTQRSVHPALPALARTALSRGSAWRVSTFHWLDNTAGGAQQATYAFGQLVQLGLDQPGVPHTVDVESTSAPPSEQTWRDYVSTMARLLGRPIITYTGDWWWTNRARSWQPHPDSPWVWAAPNVGYLPDYPGDDSPHWRAGYGGWPELAVMQYRVGPVAGIQVSQSAVRSEALWQQMGGIAVAPKWENTKASISLLGEFNAAFPNRDKGTDGTLGDPKHAQRSSDHNPDETGKTPYEDADSINEVHARDIGDRLNKAGWTMERVIKDVLLPRLRSGQEKRLQNIIHHGKVISRSWNWSEWRPASGHETWAHFGFRYGSGSTTANPENITSAWGILEAMRPPKPPVTTPEVPPVTTPSNPATWSNPDVLALNFLLKEAGFAAGYAGMTSADAVNAKNAQNARGYLAAITEYALRDELAEMNAHLVYLRGKVDSIAAGEPQPEEPGNPEPEQPPGSGITSPA